MKEAYTSIILVCEFELYICIYLVCVCIDEGRLCSFGVIFN
jgi:hypothetical protein